jgi:hypothetical protein
MACDADPFSGPVPLVEGCTVAGNYAQIRGGGIFCTVASKTRFEQVLAWGNCAGDVGMDLSLEPGASATFSCSLLDSSLVYSEGVVDYLADNVLAADPQMCAADTCTAAPSNDGDFGVGDESPCLGRHSPCGYRIGGTGRGACGSTIPVARSSWGALKSLFQNDGDTGTHPGAR